MANYAVEKWTSADGTVDEVLALLETKLELIDSAKVIRLCQFCKLKDNQYCVALVYDA